MTVKSQSRATSSKKVEAPKLKVESKPEEHPQLLESFQKSNQAQEQLHLIKEYKTQFEAQETLHQERLRAIREQLQVQLFKMWNEMWLQRQKIRDDSWKNWLKVFLN